MLTQLLYNIDIRHLGFNLVVLHEEAQHSRGAIVIRHTHPTHTPTPPTSGTMLDQSL